MRISGKLLPIVLLVSLFGCGGGSMSGSKPVTPPSTPPPVVPAMNGNWEILANSQVANTTYEGGGSFSTNGTAVTGTLHFVNSSCYWGSQNGATIFYDIPITGTLSSKGNLTASSSAVNGQTLNFSGVWSNGAISSGTYSITGGCADGDHGTVTGFPVPSLTGTYSGTFVSTTGVQIKTTVSLTQLATSGNGFYALRGAASFSGSPCFSSGTVEADEYSFGVGGYIQVPIQTTNGDLVLFQGSVTDSTGKTISGNYSVTGAVCSGDSGTGSATRQ